MAQYYQHALFALALELPHSGGFQRVEGGRPFDKIVRLPYHEDETQKGHFYVYRRPIKEDLMFISNVDQSELLTRGWVFQEWFLSRRIVHVTPNETYLECQSQRPLTMSNYAVKKIPDWAYNQRIPFRLGFKKDFEFQVGSKFDLWYKLAAVYSQMALTHSEDHFKAIAGIASEFAMILASTYATLDAGVLESEYEAQWRLTWVFDTRFVRYIARRVLAWT
ncbi:hypothetical protein LTR37_006521 [Vermiconidia calcicola]|uniref:Uncharacterized protein n=1 Tax=Vermiconidia calcicola TaxID=1690605 RepID=A0ACC3NG24_9PEZI|nr:hypothetical protein LTR37_006521 [Vermiconidia calcicola]